MKIACVVGSRPNFVKMAPLLRELKKNPLFEPTLIHTGQHYDFNLSKILFDDLNMSTPDINLDVNSSDVGQLGSACFNCFEKINPDKIIVVGDVNSSVAAAHAAYTLNIPIAHVEAGLRSFDDSMPEERNRKQIDRVSQLHFATEISAVNNLIKEGHYSQKIFLVGNLMIDSLYENIQKITIQKVEPFALLTIHRESNTNHSGSLQEIMNHVYQVANKIKIIFPIHPRTRQVLGVCTHPNINIVEPMGYFEFLKNMMHSKFVMTDSGGIQDETTALGIPCLTLRENTERPCTLAGSNRLVGKNPYSSALEILNEYKRLEVKPPLWDGHTAPRIVKILERWI